MKKLVLALFLISSISRASDSVELIGPGLTYHVIDGGASQFYDHKVSQDGRLIFTPTIGLKKTHVKDSVYHSLSLFHANNSIGSPIWGGIGATGAEIFDIFHFGLVYGGYIQNNEDFKAINIKPFSMAGNTNAFVPLLGVEMNIYFNLSNSMFLGLNNTITSIITNHNLSLGLNY